VAHCCDHKGGELARLAGQAARRRVLVVVLAINLVMFVVELAAGVIARSTALMADSVDMLGDSLVYMVSLYALSRGPRWKAGAAVLKGVVILLFGAWLIVEIVLKVRDGVTPTSSLMAVFGAIALAANATCLVLLWRFRSDDINMSSTFECSRNDVITNVGVLAAAAGVWATDHAWPDVAVGALVVVLFLRSAVRVLRVAWPQLRILEPHAASQR
jgi:Co/Zn/Cd efflux system component